MLVTATRKSTFYRNRALIEEKYGAVHRENFGADSKLNRFGYPDMGNNLYADQLPYKDWLNINNAQRQHELGYQHNLVAIPNSLIMAYNFPRAACALMSMYFILKLNHTNNYTTAKGYAKAEFSEH